MFFNKKNDIIQRRNAVILDSQLYFNELPSSIRTQLGVLKSLDKFTAYHIDDVPKQVMVICKQFEMSYEETKFLLIASYLHDVGKMFVSPEILQKPGKLTDEEFEIMKSHTIKGYEICRSFPDLVQYASVVKGHHENLDGTGYPDGLKENQIPFETRVLKVADVYSALKSKRQYKEEFTLRKIFEIMYDEVDKNKMDGQVFYALLSGVIEQKNSLIKEIKKNSRGYNEQLENSEQILEYIEKYAEAKIDAEELMQDNKINKYVNKYIKKLNDFDINTVSDINRLMVYISNYIIKLTKYKEQYEQAINDKKDLENFALLVGNKF